MAGESVLIVDDNEVNLKLARILLSEEGYDVCTADDAEAALALLATYRPQLILMDIQLPGMDGLQLTRQLRMTAGFETTVIIALTAYAMKGDEEKALAAGCDGYITKPMDLDLVLERVADHLARGRA